MKCITVNCLKGGNGKTNVCLNLTGMLAKRRKKVLCVDCDPQSNLTNDFGYGEDLDDYDYIGDIFDRMLRDSDVPPDHIVVKAPLDIMPTVDLIPSHVYLTSIEMRLVPHSTRYKLFKKYMDKHKSYFEKYDYIIFDTSPNLSVVNQNALYVSDSIILTTDIGINSLKGALLSYNEWDNLCQDFEIPNKIVGMVINKFDKRIKLSNEVIEYIKQHEILSKLSFDTLIPDNIKLRETELMNMPIAYYDTKGVGHTAYKELLKELMQKGVL